MKTVYQTRYNADGNEGRGPMVPGPCFEYLQDANYYIDLQPGVMGRRYKWSEQKYGDWDVVPVVVHSSLEELKLTQMSELVKSARAKLTAAELEALGLSA